MKFTADRPLVSGDDGLLVEPERAYLYYADKMPKLLDSGKINRPKMANHWRPCLDLAGTHWMKHAEFCPTLSKVAEPDVLLPGATKRTEIEAEIIRVQFARRPK